MAEDLNKKYASKGGFATDSPYGHIVGQDLDGGYVEYVEKLGDEASEYNKEKAKWIRNYEDEQKAIRKAERDAAAKARREERAAAHSPVERAPAPMAPKGRSGLRKGLANLEDDLKAGIRDADLAIDFRQAEGPHGFRISNRDLGGRPGASIAYTRQLGGGRGPAATVDYAALPGDRNVGSVADFDPYAALGYADGMFGDEMAEAMRRASAIEGSEMFKEHLRARAPRPIPKAPAPLAYLAEKAAPYMPAPSPGTIVKVPTPGQGGRYRGYQAGIEDVGPDTLTQGLNMLGGGAGDAASEAIGGNVGALGAIAEGAATGDVGGAVSGVASAGGGAAGKAAGTALGTAFGGPLGGAIGGALGSAAGSALGKAAGDLVGGGAKQEMQPWLIADGMTKVPAPMGYKDGGIHIAPSKRGTFTAAAKRAGKGVQEYANQIMSAPEGRYSPALRKKANFARNAKKWG